MIKVPYQLNLEAVHPAVCRIELDQVNWGNTINAGVVVGETTEIDYSVRKTDLVWAAPRGAVSCIAQSLIVSANIECGWNYALSYVGDTQIGRYRDGGHYIEHIDTLTPDADNLQRKLTAVVLLNNSNEFVGGDLELCLPSGEWKRELLRDAGDMIVFPSFMLHRVTPVTSGVRYTSVTWALGPAFR